MAASGEEILKMHNLYMQEFRRLCKIKGKVGRQVEEEGESYWKALKNDPKSASDQIMNAGSSLEKRLAYLSLDGADDSMPFDKFCPSVAPKVESHSPAHVPSASTTFRQRRH
jgi:hypothetical protein